MVHEPGRAVRLAAQTIEHRYSGFIDFVKSGRAAQRDRVQNGLDPAPLVQPRAVSLRPLRRMVGQEMHSIKVPFPYRLSDGAKSIVQFVTGSPQIRIAQPSDKKVLRHSLFIQDFLFCAKFYVVKLPSHP